MFFPALLNEHGKGVLQQAGKSGTSGRTPLAAFRRLFTTFSGPIVFSHSHVALPQQHLVPHVEVS